MGIPNYSKLARTAEVDTWIKKYVIMVQKLVNSPRKRSIFDSVFIILTVSTSFVIIIINIKI